MPIVVRYDSPALVAASAMGGAQYQQNQTAYDQAQARDQVNFRDAQSALAQRQQQQQLQVQNQRQSDQLALEQYAQSQQLNDEQKQQAIAQVLQMHAAGHVDDAQAARLLGIAQMGGNPFAERTSEEIAQQQQTQLGGQVQLTKLQANIQAQHQAAQFQQQTQLEQDRLAAEAARQQAAADSTMGRTAYTQDRIDQRTRNAVDTPAQTRLRQNDDFNRQLQSARTNVDMAKNDLAQADAAIKMLASPTNPQRARKPEDQARLDSLYAFRGTVDPATGSSTGLVKQLRDAQAALAGTASSTAATAATTRPSTQPTQIRNDDDYDALPSGALFVGTDGIKRRKP
jgi:hypothetical protein